MGTPGYIYILENVEMPNCVKIGKTINEPSNRAAQLSSVTGVPVPFVVTYKAYFADCSIAEVFVHALLESKGLRLSTNREFFSVSPSEAIAAVKQAETMLANMNPTSIEETTYFNESGTNPWDNVLKEAIKCDIGHGDTLEDKAKAVEKYKIAARLGSEYAYIQLAAIFSKEYNDIDRSIEWLKKGAERNLPDCWSTLGGIYGGWYLYSNENRTHIGNAVKCYKNYFQYIGNIDQSGNAIDGVYSLISYISLVTSNPTHLNMDEIRLLLLKVRKVIRHNENQEWREQQLQTLSIELGNHALTKGLVSLLIISTETDIEDNYYGTSAEVKRRSDELLKALRTEKLIEYETAMQKWEPFRMLGKMLDDPDIKNHLSQYQKRPTVKTSTSSHYGTESVHFYKSDLIRYFYRDLLLYKVALYKGYRGIVPLGISFIMTRKDIHTMHNEYCQVISLDMPGEWPQDEFDIEYEDDNEYESVKKPIDVMFTKGMIESIHFWYPLHYKEEYQDTED